jgi:hypothetical protein
LDKKASTASKRGVKVLVEVDASETCQSSFDKDLEHKGIINTVSIYINSEHIEKDSRGG